MIERGEQSGFALEARHAIDVRSKGRRQDFQRDVTIQLRVARARYTSPISPAPRAERTSYGPSRVPGGVPSEAVIVSGRVSLDHLETLLHDRRAGGEE